MMPLIQRMVCLAIAVMALGGCGLIRSMINTQPKVQFTEDEYQTPEAIAGGPVRMYVPGVFDDTLGPDRKLLMSQAPILVQGIKKAGTPSAEGDADSIGTPYLCRTQDTTFNVNIHTNRPAMYARVETEKVNGVWLKQLVYEFWYSERPVGGVQKGDIDGGVLRVTVDSQNRPIIYEYAQTCGCYHGAFVADWVEALAADAFPALAAGKQLHVEAEGSEWDVRDVVRAATAHSRPVLFVESGIHMLAALQTDNVVDRWTAVDSSQYSLYPYEALESIPIEGEEGRNSMFNASGLVWGAQRSGEEVLFFDLDHPGWPRHLDRMKIHWDKEGWLDDNLIMSEFRIPETVVSGQQH